MIEYTTRPLLRSDLPKTRRSTDSLKIPVLYNGEKRYVCDIHFDKVMGQTHCWLENCNGIPTKISDLLYIITENNGFLIDKKIEKLEKEIRTKQIKLVSLRIKRNFLNYLK